MTPQELKNGIISLALEGKLVEQRESEGIAEDIFHSIQSEKTRKKIRDKGQWKTEISEDEIPFEIPSSWSWCRLGAISSYAQPKEKISPSDITDDLWSLDLEDIEKGSGKIVDHRKASDRKITGEKVVFKKGQVLYSKLRPYLKKILVAPEDGICTPELVPFELYGGIDPQYIVYVLKSPHVDHLINSVTYGVKMPRVGTDTMLNLLVPLPPLQEQKRIVEKIESLMPLVDEYERLWNELKSLNRGFPADLEKSVLQIAIKGKLVEQRSTEGTGEELFALIQNEKKELIKKRLIKKEKPFSTNKEYSEYPFDIPLSWKFVRFGELMINRDSERIPVSIADRTKRTKIYDYYGASGPIDKIDSYLFDKELLLIGEDGANLLSRSTPIAFLAKGKYWVNNHAHVLDGCCGLNLKFICYCINAISLAPYVTGTAQPKMNQENMNAIWIPLPPLAEQERIVAKLDETISIIQALKSISGVAR